jgi:small subunit ribosomal protein S12
MKKEDRKKILKRPQRKGIIVKITRIKPKKPNSAKRQVAKVRISGIEKWVSVPGIGTQIERYNKVLIRGGNVVDMNQVRHKVILGIHDIKGNIRTSKRSKYGIRRDEI